MKSKVKKEQTVEIRSVRTCAGGKLRFGGRYSAKQVRRLVRALVAIASYHDDGPYFDEPYSANAARADLEAGGQE